MMQINENEKNSKKTKTKICSVCATFVMYKKNNLIESKGIAIYQIKEQTIKNK